MCSPHQSALISKPTDGLIGGPGRITVCVVVSSVSVFMNVTSILKAKSWRLHALMYNLLAVSVQMM